MAEFRFTSLIPLESLALRADPIIQTTPRDRMRVEIITLNARELRAFQRMRFMVRNRP
jgi:hypothetical protein